MTGVVLKNLTVGKFVAESESKLIYYYSGMIPTLQNWPTVFQGLKMTSVNYHQQCKPEQVKN